MAAVEGNAASADTPAHPETAFSSGPAGGRTQRAVLANVRHELRTPVNAIIGYSEMLLEDAQQDGNHDAVGDLQSILAAGKQILALLNDILDQSKIEASTVDVGSEEFAAHVKHVLRTPLNAVIGYTELLLETSADRDADAGFVADLNRILTAAKRLVGLLDQIVELSKVESGKQAIDAALPSGTSIVRDVIATISSLTPTQASTGLLECGSLLVVDDSEFNRDVLKRHLARQGFEVSVATNGREALKLAAEGNFDLILLDLVMPDLSGYQVLQRLKADRDLRHVPVIVISALDDMDTVVQCVQLGAEDYLQKPFNPILLKARIGACLEKKRLRDREQAYLEQLRLAQERSERLLLNVLPEPIAGRLKQGERLIVDRFDQATVIFADLVGFTGLSAAMPPEQLVVMLDDVFSSFDHLADRHGLEKIKTIGDSYMAAAGIPKPRHDHVEAAANMALDMLVELERFRAENGRPLRIRIGMNYGPVVAGVIGKRKFIYDLWGDTVNTASRMESHGIPDTIAVTAAVYERLRGGYALEKRDRIDVKGKGQMDVYLLKGKLG